MNAQNQFFKIVTTD